MDLNAFRDTLTGIVKDASGAILSIYNDPQLFNVEQKSDKSPLTAADKAANDIICDGLRKLPGNFPIISEENKQIPYEVRKDYTYCWMVDPLDGTKEFIKRNGEFTINIALLRHNAPVLGIIHIPVTDITYFGCYQYGAFRLIDGNWEKIECRSFDSSDENLDIICSRSHLSGPTKEYIDKFKDPNLKSRGSSLKFLEIAEGNADIYPRIAPTMEWDTAAAHIILQEAGGQLLEFATGQPLQYNKENLLNPDFIAYGKGQLP